MITPKGTSKVRLGAMLMAVAAVEEQLNGSHDLETISVEPYLRRLCQSVARSIAGDEVAVVVDAPDRMAQAAFVTSLGLIVTELLINAIKHAFPVGASHGKITVSFAAKEGPWLLSVSDNGVGMPIGEESAKPGLGTGIVDDLAKQLEASVPVRQANPGTREEIRHE